MKLQYRILVLDDDPNTLSGIVELLRDANYQVTGAATYDGAKGLLALSPYDLFITDVRLRGFNGLNLVRQSSSDYPDMAIIIITGFDEPMMEIEAGRYRAEFLRKPVDPGELLAVVERCVSAVRRQRRWRRKRVLGGFGVSINGCPAAVVDVSYGGLRLEVPNAGGVPETFDVEVAGIGLRLAVDTVWAKVSDDGQTVVCGASLSTDATPSARTWRAIVDRLTA
ncbi:MAG: response regulator [Acidobacteria bacterium]|nr:response regulator [Acidobacteriota bacterium]